VQSSNPVLTRLGEAARQQWNTGVATRAMTLDDVVVRTVALLLVTGISGAAGWLLITNGPLMALTVAGGSLAGIVLVLVITFGRVVNPYLIAAYAVIEGVVLGVMSRLFEHAYQGIVIQAVVGTFGVFAGMAVLYKLRVLRATPKFTRFVIGALIGVVVLSLLNWVVALAGGDLGLIKYGPNDRVGWLPIVFSLVAIAVGALTFILDFDQIEHGVRYGLPQQYAWYSAFGLLVGLIFLYWYILRLLGYLYGRR
jgi:uncharacterized YccA/Bax inhibitor family protein